MARKFVMPESQDYTISDTNGGSIIGHVRIKPSGVLWRDKGSHKWLRLSIEQLADLAKKHGTEQKM